MQRILELFIIIHLKCVFVFRREYQLKCAEILVQDITTAHDCNLDQSLWKSAYYQVIEVIRTMIHNTHVGGDQEQWEPRMLEQHLAAILDDVSNIKNSNIPR